MLTLAPKIAIMLALASTFGVRAQDSIPKEPLAARQCPANSLLQLEDDKSGSGCMVGSTLCGWKGSSEPPKGQDQYGICVLEDKKGWQIQSCRPVSINTSASLNLRLKCCIQAHVLADKVTKQVRMISEGRLETAGPYETSRCLAFSNESCGENRVVCPEGTKCIGEQILGYTWRA